MNDHIAFLQMFSDEAATPRPEFVESLHRTILSTAGYRYGSPKLSLKKKLIITAITILVTVATLALVFLPKRDMSDSNSDSIIESVVTTTQQSASPFTDTSPQTKPVDSIKAPTTPPNAAAQTPSQPLVTEAPLTLSGFTAEYWNYDDPASPDFPSSPAPFSTTSSDIAFNWGIGSPSPSIGSDFFLTRLTKEAVIPSGQYKVVYSADDALRMYVNETVVFDHWTDGVSSGVAYFNTDPAVPATIIIVEHRESTGTASLSVHITKL